MKQEKSDLYFLLLVLGLIISVLYSCEVSPTCPCRVMGITDRGKDGYLITAGTGGSYYVTFWSHHYYQIGDTVLK